jgi:hypothetical protein
LALAGREVIEVSEAQVQQVQKITPISTITINIKVYKDNAFYWADIDIDDTFKWTYGPKEIALSYDKALDGLLYAIRNLSNIRDKFLVHSNFEVLLMNLTEALASVLMYINQKD